MTNANKQVAISSGEPYVVALPSNPSMSMVYFPDGSMVQTQTALADTVLNYSDQAGESYDSFNQAHLGLSAGSADPYSAENKAMYDFNVQQVGLQSPSDDIGSYKQYQANTLGMPLEQFQGMDANIQAGMSPSEALIEAKSTVPMANVPPPVNNAPPTVANEPQPSQSVAPFSFLGAPALPMYSDLLGLGNQPVQGFNTGGEAMDDLTSALDAANDLGLASPNRYKNTTSELTGVRYGGDKPAFEYDLGEDYNNVVAVKQGNSLKFYKDGERLGRDEVSDALNIDVLSINRLDSGNDKIRDLKNQLRDQEVQDVYDQFGGEDSELVSEYLADEAAAAKAQAKKDDKKDEKLFGKIDTDIKSDTFGQRTGGTMGALNEQVKKEADALGISTDEYYDLPLSQRLSMAASDIEEVFDPSQGSLFDKDSGRALGTLGSENLASASKAAKDYYDDIDTSADSPFFEIPDVSGAVDDPMYGVGVYTPQDDDYSGSTYDDLDGALTKLSADAVDFDYPLAGGVNIPGTNITITGGGGDDIIDGPVIDGPVIDGPVIDGPVIDDVINDDVIDDPEGGGGGSGITFSDPLYSRPSSNFGLTLDDVLVPSTVNYGTDPRFANLAPTFKVSQAAMPSLTGLPITPPVEETATMAQGGIVSLAGGGTPKGEGITPDFMIDYYNKSLIPRALDGNEAARKAVLEAHSNFSNFTLPEELLLKIKYGRANGGVASLSDTARNMFRPMVS